MHAKGTIVKPIVLQVICTLFWAPIRVNCETWISYELQKMYADKLCSAHFIVNEFLTSHLLHCVAACPYKSDCSAAIYNRKNKTCYTLRSGFQPGDCSLELIGAVLYSRKGTCPRGWVFLHQSCFTVTDKKQDQASSMAICKLLYKDAHLADLTTQEEHIKIVQWLENESYDSWTRFWLGAMYTKDDGWKYGNGTNIEGWQNARLDKMCLSFRDGKIPSHTECNAPIIGICEMKSQ